jgi:hypothetical protein
MAKMTAEEFRQTVAALGWSASQVAEWVGRDASTGRRWTRGDLPVPPRVAAWLRRRLDALMLDPAPRLGAPKPPPPPTPATAGPPTPRQPRSAG